MRQIFEMEQEEESFQLFNNQSKQLLFDRLASNIKFNSRPFTQQDFKVDLVMRLKVPNIPLMPKEQELTFDRLFKNIPIEYEEVYQEALEYVHYLAVNDPNINVNNLPQNVVITRCMTTFKQLPKLMEKNKQFINKKLEDENFIMDCQYEYFSDLDCFTLKYNIIMIILEHFCGFNVRSYLIDDKGDEGDEGLEQGRAIYFLISQSNENLMKIANKVGIKKEIDMTDIDFNLNDATDKLNRPIKYHSYFRGQSYYQSFVSGQKSINRVFGIKETNISKDIMKEQPMKNENGEKFIAYSEETFDKLIELYRSELITITHREKSYLFNINRHKLNDGCLRLYYVKKLKRLFYQKIKDLNRKYGYKYYEYDDNYFEFRMPAKSKPFFQKLDHLLNYKTYTVNRSGQISLFSKLQRIKLSYICLQNYFKTQNFGSCGLEVYAIHDNFQRFGDITHEDNNDEAEDEQQQNQKVKIVCLKSVWYPFFSFRSSVKKIRDYMGQNIAFQVMVRIYLTTFFMVITPFSIGSQFILNYYFQGASPSHTYKFCLLELIFMIISLNLLIVVWSKNQDKFFDNFAHISKQRIFRDGYKGPYYRSLTSDNPNEHLIQKTLKQRLVGMVCYLIIVSILVLEGVFFWGMRMSIVLCYQNLNLVQWRFLSLPHLIFYGVYFAVNQLLHSLIFLRLIDWLVEFQAFSTRTDHDQRKLLYKSLLIFGIQLMGPFFFYILEPFQGVSCYAAECVNQFSRYIYSRYEILFIHIFLRFHKFLWQMMNGLVLQFTQDQDEKIKPYLSFEGRLNYLLKFVKNEYKKKQAQQNYLTQSIGLLHYVIFKINFPFCTLYTYLLLQLEYIFGRFLSFTTNRRPIPMTDILYKLQKTFINILHTCIIFNAWAITFSYEFVEYDFIQWVDMFVNNITEDNILSFKLFIAVGIIIILEVFSVIIKNVFHSFFHSPLQLRKKVMYEKYLHKIRDKPIKSSFPDLKPIKTIFRTYTYEGVMQNKRKKYKIYQAIKSQMTKSHKLSMSHNYQNIKIEEQNVKIESNARILAQ